MLINNNNDPIRIVKRDGSTENPFVDITETRKVISGIVLLQEIPNKDNRVLVRDSLSNLLNEVNNKKDVVDGSYYVDYRNSLVIFHQNQYNQEFTFEYKGEGLVLYPVSRIYNTTSENPNVIETLDSIIQGIEADIVDIESSSTYATQQGDYAKAQGDYANTQGTYAQTEGDKVQNKLNELDIQETDINNAINNANTSATNAQNTADNAQEIIDEMKFMDSYNSTTTYNPNNIVEYNNAIYVNLQQSTGIAPTNATYWKQYWTAEQVIQNAITATNDANTATSNANTAISDMNTLETNVSSAESTRQTNESTRQSQESTRVTQENTRQTNESTRQTNESGRSSAESTRESNETTRETNESTRVSQENTRQTNETNRETSEGNRVSAENTREINETTRETNESTRVSQESTRQINESGRESAEADRVANENVRQSQESTRQTNETNRQNTLTEMNQIIDDLDHLSEWNNLTTYSKLNMVRYNGSTYISNVDNNTGNQPVAQSDSTEWNLIAVKGLDGAGSVSSVNNVTPDINGNVSLTPNDIGASPSGHTHSELHNHTNKNVLDDLSDDGSGGLQYIGVSVGEVKQADFDNHVNDYQKHFHQSLTKPTGTVAGDIWIDLSDDGIDVHQLEIDFDNHLTANNPHGITTTSIGAEPEITKNTAFNKDFGTTSGTVAEGNHTHSELHNHTNKNILDDISDNSGRIQYKGYDVEDYIRASSFASGASLDLNAIQSAIDYASTAMQKTVLIDNDSYIGISGTITVKQGVALVFQRGCTIGQYSNVDTFIIEKDAKIVNGDIAIDMGGYTSNVIKLEGSQQFYDVFDDSGVYNTKIYSWGGDNLGTALKLEAFGTTAGERISYVNFQDLKISGFKTAIHMETTAPNQGEINWINANRFTNITIEDCIEGIVLNGMESIPNEVSGNQFKNIQYQLASYTETVAFITGSDNVMDIIVWDEQLISNSDPLIYIDNESARTKLKTSYNMIQYDRISDEGYLSQIEDTKINEVNTDISKNLNHGLNLIETEKSGLVDIEVNGQTLVNYMGNDGKFGEDADSDGLADNWLKHSTDGDLSLIQNDIGNRQRITANSADTSQFGRRVKIDKRLPVGKYVIRFEVNTNSNWYGRVNLYDYTNSVTLIDSSDLGSGFHYYTFESLNEGSCTLQFYNQTPVGNTDYVEYFNVGIYRVDDSTYNDIGVGLNTDDIKRIFPYVDNIANIENPYIQLSGNNLLPSFKNWSLHANAEIISDSELSLEASGNWQESSVIIDVLPNTTYIFSHEEHQQWVIRGKNSQGNNVETLRYVDDISPVIFTTGNNTTQIQVATTNSSTGTFIYKNPMISLGSELKPYELKNPSHFFARTSLAGNRNKHDTIFYQDGEWKKNQWFEQVEITGANDLSFYSEHTGFKVIEVNDVNFWGKDTITNDNVFSCNHKGEIVLSGDVTLGGNRIDKTAIPVHPIISINDYDSGWTETMTPTSGQMKAYFNGWRYTGDGTNHSWEAMEDPSITVTTNDWAYVSSTVATEGFNHYKIIHRYEYQSTIPVVTEGQLSIQGRTHATVGEDVVYKELADVIGNYGTYYMINATDVPSELDYEVEEIIAVYKNGYEDTQWVISNNESKSYGLQRVDIHEDYFDPTAIYEVTYKPLYKRTNSINNNKSVIKYSNSVQDSFDNVISKISDQGTSIDILKQQMLQLLIRIDALEGGS